MGSRLKWRDQTPDLPPPKTQDRQVSVGGDMYTEGLPVLWRSDPEGQRGGRWATQHPSESEDKTAGHLVHGAGQAVSRSTSFQEAAAWLPAAIHMVTYWLHLPSTTKAGGGPGPWQWLFTPCWVIQTGSRRVVVPTRPELGSIPRSLWARQGEAWVQKGGNCLGADRQRPGLGAWQVPGSLGRHPSGQPVLTLRLRVQTGKVSS